MAVDKKEIAFDYTWMVGAVLLAVALYFVWRSFYAMRIPPRDAEPAPAHAGTVAAGEPPAKVHG